MQVLFHRRGEVLLLGHYFFNTDVCPSASLGNIGKIDISSREAAFTGVSSSRFVKQSAQLRCAPGWQRVTAFHVSNTKQQALL